MIFKINSRVALKEDLDFVVGIIPKDTPGTIILNNYLISVLFDDEKYRAIILSGTNNYRDFAQLQQSSLYLLSSDPNLLTVAQKTKLKEKECIK